jgi:polyhydroxyalkanoate synthase
MAGGFQLLRANDLIWSRLEHEYLLGQRESLNDLMAWNADGTRLPYRMHSEYLRKMFLHNDLAECRYDVAGRPICLRDIRTPIFAVGTVRDHVAPWQSVFQIHRLTETDLTFVLTSGGHNAGIVSEPGHPRRSYQLATRKVGDRYVDPKTWQATAPKTEGSWWQAWQAWLLEHSTGPAPAPTMGCPANGCPALSDAPGVYVLEE